MKNTLKSIAMLLTIVFASSYDWSWGLSIILIIVLAHVIQYLLDKEDKEIAEIEQRQMEIDKKLEEINWMKRDYRIGKFMEEN